LDNLDRMLLDRIQRSFPLVARPYHELASGLETNGEEVMGRIRALKERSLVRQISAIFNTGALGYRSSLVAMAVEEPHLEKAAAAVNAYPGVSHNYLRPGHFNMWFTLAVPPMESLDKVVSRLAREAGGWKTIVLPALKKYKLAVVLDVLEEGDLEAAGDRSSFSAREEVSVFEPTAANIEVVRCIQEDLPLVEKPFHEWARNLGMAGDELLHIIGSWLQQGIMRRFAAVLNHRQVGFKANGMVVWKCPEDHVDSLGAVLASHAEVSHCYHRPAHPGWPFNLYAMVHGRNVEECERVAGKLGKAIGLHDYRILFSTREFKKIRLKLFWEDSPSGGRVLTF